MNEEKETVAKSKAKPQEEVTVSPKAAYPKEQLVLSSRFAATDRDILAVVLGNDKRYTLDEVESALQTFKNKEVK